MHCRYEIWMYTEKKLHRFIAAPFFSIELQFCRALRHYTVGLRVALIILNKTMHQSLRNNIIWPWLFSYYCMLCQYPIVSPQPRHFFLFYSSSSPSSHINHFAPPLFFQWPVIKVLFGDYKWSHQNQNMVHLHLDKLHIGMITRVAFTQLN